MSDLHLEKSNFSDNESIQSIASVSKKDCDILTKHKDCSLFKSYLIFLKFEKRYSPQTLRVYGHALAELSILSCGKSTNTIKPATIRLAIGQARTQGMKTSAIAHRLSVWRSYLRWLGQKLEIVNNPLDGIKTKKLPKKLPEILSVDQMQHLLDQKCPVKQKKSNDLNQIIFYRNKAILELFYSSGLRLSELIGLNIHYTEKSDSRFFGWLDMSESTMNIIGKGNKRRIVPIGQKAYQALITWLSVRPTILNPNNIKEPALFISTRSRRISPSAVRAIVETAGLEAELPIHLHPHMLRHSFASHLLQSSNNIRAVQKLLGHQSIASTQIYTSLDFQYLSRAYDAAHPRALSKIRSKK